MHFFNSNSNGHIREIKSLIFLQFWNAFDFSTGMSSQTSRNPALNTSSLVPYVERQDLFDGLELPEVCVLCTSNCVFFIPCAMLQSLYICRTLEDMVSMVWHQESEPQLKVFLLEIPLCQKFLQFRLLWFVIL